MATITLRHAVVSHSGVRRKNNEDALLALPDRGVWMVADGMGGHDSGEVASRIACETVQSTLENGGSLVFALESAHQAIQRRATQSPASLSMGSTAVLLRMEGADFEIAWVGDSRAYLHDHAVHPLTRDHSFVEMLRAEGVINAEQARKHPQRSVITQALGVDSNRPLKVGTAQGKLPPDTRLVLCSDGLTEVLSDIEIGKLLDAHPGDLEGAGKALLHATLAGGGPDNVTFVLIEHVKNDAPQRR
ncbi:MAG: PP2C family protein-serine/threonine phosphatase [Pseudomarimonas sp.]